MFCYFRTTAALAGVALLLLCATAAPAGDEADGARPFGLAQRVPWTTSKITGSPDPPAPYGVERVFSNLQFKNPVVFTRAPGSERMFLAELDGRIFSLPRAAGGGSADLFFDMRAELPQVDHVYGLTFHPDFAENRFCYICYTLAPDLDDGTRVSRFVVRDGQPPQVDASSEQVLLSWRSGGHNGGCLKFGPDGMLYISTGDAGPAFPPDPLESGQNLANLMASVLRIDVNRGSADRAYAIPADNPFLELDGARGEIWAYGFRNPWRMSFDERTGALWLGDVGWELWEMVYRVERGANYGWSLVEGPQPVHRERTRGPTPIVPPTALHSHIEARSITGGFVYRGQRLKKLAGAYVYGDYVTGKIWALRHDGQRAGLPEELVDTPLQIICFGVDHDEELYVVAYDGTIHRLVENRAAAANRDFPTKLSETGLFASVPAHRVAAGVIPYSINAEPWMDGAVAERFVALPGTSSLGIHDSTNVQIGYIKGTWQFPTDAVLMKTISLPLEAGNRARQHRLETQILHFDVDTWRAYSYLWNDEQTEAVLAEDRASSRSFEVRDPQAPGGLRRQTWNFASRTECLLCHTTRGGSIYGFNPAQLNRPHDYGGVVDNQLRTLAHIGLFAETPQPSAPMPDPHDAAASLEQRARAYLHVNCAHCHRRGGGGTAAMDIQYQLPLDKTNLLTARPTQGTFGIHAAEVLAPGDPYRSVLLYRMAKLGRGRMPHLGSSLVDQRGLQLLRDWIAALDAPAAPATRRAVRQAQRTLVERLCQGPPDGPEIVEQLLSSTSGALLLLAAVDQGQLGPPQQALAVQAATRHDDVQIRDLFERFLPESQRTRRLGRDVDAEALLARGGQAARGRELFLHTAGVQCRNCHRVGQEGRALGPDLDEIGKKYSRRQLLDSILQPSKDIDPRYLSHLVETSDGRVLVGLLVEKTDRQVVLKDAQAKEIRIAAAEVEFFAPQQKSLMPELLLQDMTAQDVADLLEFLTTLK